jgi:hypothetical protein
VQSAKVYWTYHVHMRLSERSITTADIEYAAGALELVEAYSDDKYFPSYLVLGRSASGPIHILFALDVEGDNVRVVTAYHPDPLEWGPDLKSRRRP